MTSGEAAFITNSKSLKVVFYAKIEAVCGSREIIR
jgi:hypothetical protein